MADNEKRQKGREIVSKLFKDGPVGDLVPMPKRFREITVNHVFGEVWQGEDLELTERHARGAELRRRDARSFHRRPEPGPPARKNRGTDHPRGPLCRLAGRGQRLPRPRGSLAAGRLKI